MYTISLVSAVKICTILTRYVFPLWMFALLGVLVSSAVKHHFVALKRSYVHTCISICAYLDLFSCCVSKSQ